jgi:hypothetical protein
VNIFEEMLGKMDTTDFEANWEKLEGVTVHEKVLNEEIVVRTDMGNGI